MAVSKNGVTINIFLGFTTFDNTYLAINSKKKEEVKNMKSF